MRSKGALSPMGDTTNVIEYEQHVEYRDQDGNLLNEEQVRALEGQVEFKTIYETTTRLLDVHGNELPEGYVVDELKTVGEEGETEPIPVELAPTGVNDVTPRGEQKLDEQIEVEGAVCDVDANASFTQ